ncbi:MAG: pilus assembly protein PilM [Candidatus Omnitrophica bacterium]|nr:pilus assembly protein PilM [Candidatus Omnitrophota bacterium]
MFKKKQNIKIALDWGSYSLKIVKLESINNRHIIRNFLFVNIASSKDVLSLIKDSLFKLEVGSLPISMSASGHNVICRYINFPLMNEEEFKEAIKFEAPKYIPFSFNDVYFDSIILKKDTSAKKMLVLIAAAKKDYIDQRIDVIKKVGFNVSLIDIDSLAISNCFNFNFSKDASLKNKAVVLLNIGSSITNLNILEDRIAVLSRDIKIAGDDFTKRISSDLGCDFETAEGIKTQPDEEQIQKIRPSLEAVASLLAQEIRISLDYYESQSVSTVDKLYLTGGSSILINLKEILSRYLDMEVEIWDPLVGFEVSESINQQEIYSKSRYLAVSLGLALR